MKTINFVKNLATREIESVELKKTFEYHNHNFAVVKQSKETYSGSKRFYFDLALIHFESGSKIPMYLPTKKTIKDFCNRSFEAIDQLIKGVGIVEFEKTLNVQPKIN
jgi:hypothetical protein